MRICILSRAMERHRPGYLWPFEILSRDFARAGHEVTVLTTGLPDGAPAIDRMARREVHYLPGTRPERVDAAFWRDSAATFARMQAAAPFDIVIGRGASSWGLVQAGLAGGGKGGGMPLISHEGTYPAWMHGRALHPRPWSAAITALDAGLRAARAKERPLRACLAASARVVCVSPGLERALRRMAWWAPPRTVTLPYALDLSRWPEPAARPEPRLVYVGRLSEAKGAAAMPAILARMRRPAVLEVIGGVTDAERAAMEAHAACAGVADRLRLVGALPHADLPGRLHGATAFLFPSTHPEGLSKVVMEAMAAGLPVVAWRLPAHEGLVEDGRTGWLLPPGDIAGTAARLDALLDDPARAAAMGAAGRAHVARHHAPDVIAARWQALFDAVRR